MNASELINDAATLAKAGAALPTPIAPELALAGIFFGWLGGALSRRAAGQPRTDDEVALLEVLGNTLALARQQNDDSDAAAAAEVAGEGK